LRLFNSNFAPNPRRVRIFLAEKGVSIPRIEVDLAKLDHKSDAFAKLNPFQTIPLLELDDGTVLSESIAICRYIEELHPEPNLFGETPVERATIEMWQRRAEWHLLFPIAQVFRHSHPHMAAMEQPQVKDWAEANRPRALRSLKIFDEALEGRDYLAGNRFTVADITGIVALDFLRPARLAISPELGNLTRWRERFAARPSASA
jgi:glutathione S-transferase